MPITAGDTIKLTFKGTCFSQAVFLDLTYVCTVGTPIATIVSLQEFITAVGPGGPAANQIADSYLACLPPQYLGMVITAQVLRPVRSAYTSITFAAANGTNANAATVACDSAAVTRRTALSGRNQISTLKVGPAPDGASAAGLLTVAYTNLLTTFNGRTLLQQVMPVSTAQYKPAILTKIGNYDNRDLVTGLVTPESRVMRRRVVGRGI